MKFHIKKKKKLKIHTQTEYLEKTSMEVKLIHYVRVVKTAYSLCWS